MGSSRPKVVDLRRSRDLQETVRLGRDGRAVEQEEDLREVPDGVGAGDHPLGEVVDLPPVGVEDPQVVDLPEWVASEEMSHQRKGMTIRRRGRKESQKVKKRRRSILGC